jgi:enediyne biosynthesis protein CalE5
MMTATTFDPVQYKEVQRKDWTDAARGWRTWWPKIEAGVGVVSERLVDLAEIGPGDRVLDVATGIGEPALLAAGRVSPGGRVVGTDIAPGMIALARERAAEAGVDNVEFIEVDAEALDFTDGEFDAVMSRFGLMFFPDLAEALARMRRALVPGGRLAAAVWAQPERAPFVSIAFRVVAQELELPPPGPGVPGPFSLADVAALEAAVRAAGFDDVRSETVAMEVEFESAEEYGAFMHDIAAPIHGMLAQRPAEQGKAVWDKIVDAARQFERDGGTIVMPGEAVCVVGRAPADR